MSQDKDKSHEEAEGDGTEGGSGDSGETQVAPTGHSGDTTSQGNPLRYLPGDSPF